MSKYRTQSLFHYTSKRDNLLKIIASGVLYPNYCKEELSTKLNPNYVLGIPQICFCDIPLSQADVLRKNYGKYAIAFDKAWGIDKGCNPLLYVCNESIIDGLIHYRKTISEYRKKYKVPKKADDINNDNFKEVFMSFVNPFLDKKAHDYTIGYLKLYKGEWEGKEYCNYNENEWRYILEDGINGVFWKTGEEYDSWRGLTFRYDKLKRKIPILKPSPSKELQSLGLSFSPDNIKHIVLDNDSEVPSFIKKIQEYRNMFNYKIEEKDFNLLLSKITSFERIRKDF